MFTEVVHLLSMTLVLQIREHQEVQDLYGRTSERYTFSSSNVNKLTAELRDLSEELQQLKVRWSLSHSFVLHVSLAKQETVKDRSGAMMDSSPIVQIKTALKDLKVGGALACRICLDATLGGN